jgi:hypothetical protein
MLAARRRIHYVPTIEMSVVHATSDSTYLSEFGQIVGQRFAFLRDKFSEKRWRIYGRLVPTLCKQRPRGAWTPILPAPRALLAYKDFLALWKDADPDIPILKEVKTEYAKLQ